MTNKYQPLLNARTAARGRGLSDGASTAALLLGFLIGSLVFFFFQAWLVMLIIGALHATIWTSLPPVGYWASCLVTLALRFVGGFFRSSSK